MARDLNIRITADNTDAKAKLGETEKDIAGIGKSSGEAQKALGGSGSGLIGAVGGLALALGGLALVEVGKNVIEFGSKLTDLRDKTGLTLEELQKFNYAGSTVGLSIDTIANAVNRLQKNLGTGGEGVNNALSKLNLNIKDLQEMAPGAMFETMAEAISKVPSPTERTQLAMALLGRTGAELLPLMLSNIKDLGNEAPVMSDKTIEALDHFDDAWSKAKIFVMASIGGMIGAFAQETSSLQGFVEANTGLLGMYFSTSRQGYEDVGKAIADAGAKLNEQSVKTLPAALKPLEDAMSSTYEFAQANKDSEDKIRKNIAAMEAHQKAINDLADTYTGKKLAKQVEDVAEAFALAKKQGGILSQSLPELSRQLDTLRSRGAVLPPQLNAIADAFKRNAQTIQRDLVPVIYQEAVPSLEYMQQQWDNLLIKQKDWDKFTNETLGGTFKKLRPPPENIDAWKHFKDEVSDTLGHLNTAIQGEFAKIILGAESFKDGFVGVWQSIKASVSQIVAEFMSEIVGRVLKGFVNMLTGAGSFGSAFNGILGSVLGGGGAAGGAAAGGGAGAGVGAGALAGAIGSAAIIAGAFLPGILINGFSGEGTIPTPAGDDGRPHPASGYFDDGTIDPLGPFGSQLQGMASGGMVRARPGGTIVRLAEAGEDEFVVPKSKMGGGTNIVINAQGAFFRDREALRELAFLITPHIPAAAGAYKLDIRG